jgi:hypothetical protein
MHGNDFMQMHRKIIETKIITIILSNFLITLLTQSKAATRGFLKKLPTFEKKGEIFSAISLISIFV